LYLTNKFISVFCGSHCGKDLEYIRIAEQLGRKIALRGFGLVYGGAKIGLMGAVADGVMSEGGQVIGIITDFLRDMEIAHEGITRLETVSSMHERKMRMAELCDAVIALPGGLGTMDELFEMLTLAQLGLHSKPVGLLNVNGFYDPLLALMDNMVDDGFMYKTSRELLFTGNDMDKLLDAISKNRSCKHLHPVR
jgi:uncharacterized protein (TIGR00730 family)